MYVLGKYFLCRHCYDLSYQSQRKDKKERALRRARKIRQHLGGSANMLEPFPESPKGMHLETYMKLFWEHQEAEMEHLAGMRSGWTSSSDNGLAVPPREVCSALLVER